jgi:hypothetical protein
MHADALLSALVYMHAKWREEERKKERESSVAINQNSISTF